MNKDMALLKRDTETTLKEGRDELYSVVKQALYTNHNFDKENCSNCGVSKNEFKETAWPCRKGIENTYEASLFDEIDYFKNVKAIVVYVFVFCLGLSKPLAGQAWAFNSELAIFGWVLMLFLLLCIITFFHCKSKIKGLIKWFRIEEIRHLANETSSLLIAANKKTYKKIFDNFVDSLFMANSKIPQILSILRENSLNEVKTEERMILDKLAYESKDDEVLRNTLQQVQEKKRLILVLNEKINQFWISKQNALETIKVLKMRLEIDKSKVIDDDLKRVFEEISLLSKIFKNVEKSVD